MTFSATIHTRHLKTPFLTFNITLIIAKLTKKKLQKRTYVRIIKE